jgi:hypothetical protein
MLESITSAKPLQLASFSIKLLYVIKSVMLKLKNNLTEEEKKELDKQTKMLIEETDKLYGIDKITKHGEIRRADGEKHGQKKSRTATTKTKSKARSKARSKKTRKPHYLRQVMHMKRIITASRSS